MNKELQKLLLAQQEEQSYHLPMEAEYSFYRRIANGDMELLKLNMNADTMEGMGKLSSSPLQNKKYHLVILTAMITRFCIEAGLDPEQAYTLSDMHIRKIDACLTPEQLNPRKGAVVKDFVLAMHELHNSPGLSYHVMHQQPYHRTDPGIGCRRCSEAPPGLYDPSVQKRYELQSLTIYHKRKMQDGSLHAVKQPGELYRNQFISVFCVLQSFCKLF